MVMTWSKMKRERLPDVSVKTSKARKFTSPKAVRTTLFKGKGIRFCCGTDSRMAAMTDAASFNTPTLNERQNDSTNRISFETVKPINVFC